MPAFLARAGVLSAHSPTSVGSRGVPVAEPHRLWRLSCFLRFPDASCCKRRATRAGPFTRRLISALTDDRHALLVASCCLTVALLIIPPHQPNTLSPTPPRWSRTASAIWFLFFNHHAVSALRSQLKRTSNAFSFFFMCRYKLTREIFLHFLLFLYNM